MRERERGREGEGQRGWAHKKFAHFCPWHTLRIRNLRSRLRKADFVYECVRIFFFPFFLVPLFFSQFRICVWPTYEIKQIQITYVFLYMPRNFCIHYFFFCGRQICIVEKILFGKRENFVFLPLCHWLMEPSFVHLYSPLRGQKVAKTHRKSRSNWQLPVEEWRFIYFQWSENAKS